MPENKRGINPILKDINVTSVDQVYQQELARVLDDASLLDKLKSRGIDRTMIDGNLGQILDFEATDNECCDYHKIHGHVPCNTQIVELLNIDGQIVRQLSQCPYQIQLDRKRLRYLYSDFPKEWINLNLDSIETHLKRGIFLRELVDLVKGDKHWIYVYGRAGRGKAYMVVSALNELLIKNENATFAFVDYPALVAENMVDYFANRAKVDQVVSSLSEVDYLVLNHFANEELSEIVRSAITMPLLSNRDANRKTTIIISHISLQELEELHKSGKNNQIRARQLVGIIEDNIKKPIYLQGEKIYE